MSIKWTQCTECGSTSFRVEVTFDNKMWFQCKECNAVMQFDREAKRVWFVKNEE